MIRCMHVENLDTRDLRHTQDAVRHAVDTLRGGGLVAIPTETVYGLAVCADQADAVQRLRQLKQTAADASFTVHLPQAEHAQAYCNLTPALRRIAGNLWPGPVVLRLEVSHDTMAEKLAALHLPGDAKNRIYTAVGLLSLRCPEHEMARRVLAAVKAPIIATSANLPNTSPATSADAVAKDLGDRIDFVLDGGRCRYGKPSTIVRVNTHPRGIQSLKVEPGGVLDERVIRKLTRWSMLLVCSGNTCRSPMAEGIAKQMLAEQRGLAVEDLETAGLHVASAGVFAGDGMPASAQAVQAMHEQGIDIGAHRSQVLTAQMVRDADVVLCMTTGHRHAVLQLVPDAEDKTFRLNPGRDIEDPIGSDQQSYQRTAEVIRQGLAQRLKEQQL